MNGKYLLGTALFAILYILAINYIIESNNCNNRKTCV